MSSTYQFLRSLCLLVCIFSIHSITAFADTGTEDGWTIPLIGAQTDQLHQEDFETPVYTSDTEHFASLVDSQGQVWDGIPVWLLTQIGAKKQEQTDGSSLSDKSYKQDWSVIVTGSDGREFLIEYKNGEGDNSYILANSLNGRPFDPSEPLYPLTLAGKDLPLEKQIQGITSIRFIAS